VWAGKRQLFFATFFSMESFDPAFSADRPETDEPPKVVSIHDQRLPRTESFNALAGVNLNRVRAGILIS
jgi:hypothetical protein